MITQKYYKDIAKIFNKCSDNRNLKGYLDIDELINDFCNYFKKDNPKFDIERFKRAIENGNDIQINKMKNKISKKGISSPIVAYNQNLNIQDNNPNY